MSTIRPFSDNVVFMDAEFTSLDPYVGEIISLALVKADGEELYLELEFDEKLLNDWTKENVVPHLRGGKVSREGACRQICEFLGDNKPFLLTYVSQFDTVFWHKLFGGIEKNPAHWIVVDFASFLFFNGIDPERYLNEQGKLFGISEEGEQHNALYDARLLRKSYCAALKQLS